MNSRKSAAAIIAAGGKSERMGGCDKLFADLGGIPIIISAVSAFEKASEISEIIIAAKPESAERIQNLCRIYNISKLKAVVKGGADRQDSVLNALKEVGSNIDIIAVHDGARPLVTSDFVNEITLLAREKGAVIPAVRVKETIKSVKGGRIISTPDRKELYSAQTPQTFLLSNYLEAVKLSENTISSSPTDDASLLENAGFEVFITEGDYKNIKITTPEDLKAARAMIYEKPQTELRIGFGYDVHRLVKGRRLILCGVEIPYEEGLLGHSDADVAVHSLIDALLGAAALGDIGVHFPDSEPQYKDASSIKLLAHTVALITEKGYTPSNIDITIIAEHPKLAPYILKMRTKTAEICGISLDAVSVKATTEEGLGLSGKGIGAKTVCLLKKRIIT
ncbi:MAG: 2-C-methyl-D-erythritol 2,4-cyclodiphosphate synthase [Oscillospiraceae bacterium]|nr:2-C-methyl-D-erythritol 2,4-cyclodiphosphate synthase [Oscillospiraceae bacterium]